MPPPARPPDVGKTADLNGKVVSYGTNPEGNIDRMVLNQGNRKPEIHFPPHLAKDVLEIATVNTSVHIKTSLKDRGYELVSIASEDGKKVFDAGKILPPKPRPGKEIRIAGAVSGWIRNRENAISGFIIGKKTVLLNPDESRILTPLLRKAGRIEVAALEREAGDGTLNTFKFPPVKATEIKIDSIIYKIR